MDFHIKEEGVRIDLDYGVLNISSEETSGFRPFQLMVASIAGCSASVFRKILKKQRVEMSDMTITADVDRNPDEADRIERIGLHYVIKGYHLDDDKLYKNLALARKNCSMVRSVEDSITIEETLETVELSN